MKKLKEILSAVAPTIAKTLGGPLAGTGVQFLLEKLGLSEKAEGKTLDERAEILAGALETATPDQLIQLRKIEAEFVTTMRRADIDEKKIDQLNTEGARQMFIATRDKTPRQIAILTFSMFVATLGVLCLFAVYRVSIPEAVMTLLGAVVGALMSHIKQISQFYFGSSASSERKTEILSHEIQSLTGGVRR